MPNLAVLGASVLTLPSKNLSGVALRLKQTLSAVRKSHARAYSNTLNHARINRTHLSHAIGAGRISMYLNGLSHAIS